MEYLWLFLHPTKTAAVTIQSPPPATKTLNKTSFVGFCLLFPCFSLSCFLLFTCSVLEIDAYGQEFVGNTDGPEFVRNKTGLKFVSNADGLGFVGKTDGPEFAGSTNGLDFVGHKDGLESVGNAEGAEWVSNKERLEFAGNGVGLEQLPFFIETLSVAVPPDNEELIEITKAQIFKFHKMISYTWNVQNFTCVHNSCEIWHLFFRASMTNSLVSVIAEN